MHCQSINISFLWCSIQYDFHKHFVNKTVVTSQVNSQPMKCFLPNLNNSFTIRLIHRLGAHVYYFMTVVMVFIWSPTVYFIVFSVNVLKSGSLLQPKIVLSTYSLICYTNHLWKTVLWYLSKRWETGNSFRTFKLSFF